MGFSFYFYLTILQILVRFFFFFLIFHVLFSSRELAEQSPYYESFKKRNVEVLFCYEPYDELVLMQLGQYNSRALTSVEKEMRQDNDASKDDDFRE